MVKKTFTYKCIGFCGRTERKSFKAKDEEEAGEKLSNAPSSVKPYSEARLINVRNCD